MEVILKKTKITASVLKQTILPGISEYIIFNVVGWCVFDNIKWIVMYKENELRKIPLGFTVEMDKYNSSEAVVHFHTKFSSIHYKLDSRQQVEDVIKLSEKVKSKAIGIGQFYI